MKRNQAVGAMIVVVVVVFTCWPLTLAAQAPLQNTPPEAPELPMQLSGALLALGRLSLAAALASVLALRPRRLGTPNRRPEVIHTQIILAVVGSLVMLVVGTSLARAFGIVGAAGLVRYRAKVEDPKDAGVMLSTLAIGLATGVGQWVLAIEGTFFLLTLLWTIESFAPTATTLFDVTIKCSEVATLKDGIEALLNRHKAKFSVRATSPEEIVYEVHWPVDRPSGRLSERIAAIDPSRKIEVVVDQKKEK